MSNKKILLISPSVSLTRSTKAVHRFDPPLSLIYVGTFMKKHGYEIEIVETVLRQPDWEKIRAGEYLLVGMCVYIGEFMKTAKQYASKIKEINPATPIVWGGVMPSAFHVEMLQQYPVDYIVRFEGENTLLDLAEALNGRMDLKDVKGISYKSGGEVIRNEARMLENNLDNFPVPDWTLLGDDFNVNQNPYYYKIMTSKGCPYSCSFCYNLTVDPEIQSCSPRWRHRSAEHVAAEIGGINKVTGGTVFTFGDDNCMANKKRLKKILSYMRDNGFYAEQIIGHLNLYTDDIIDEMGGIVQTALYSIESASQRLHKILDKSINLDRVKPVNKALADRGIVTIHSFIAGLPTEEDEDLRANVEVMLELKEICTFARGHMFFYYPVPHTPLRKYVEKELGYKLPNDLKTYENAEFYFGVEEMRETRPWLSADRFDFITKYIDIFNDAFRTVNMELSQKTLDTLADNPKLREIFAGIQDMRRPKKFYDPYVLDRVLRNEKIDLLNDIKPY